MKRKPPKKFHRKILSLATSLTLLTRIRADSIRVWVRARMCVWVCVFPACAFGWVINERSRVASAGHDSTTERKSFLLPPWTADSELAGISCWLLKSHHGGAVIITPITASQRRASRLAVKKEIEVAVNDISSAAYGQRPELWVEIALSYITTCVPQQCVCVGVKKKNKKV